MTQLYQATLPDNDQISKLSESGFHPTRSKALLGVNLLNSAKL